MSGWEEVVEYTRDHTHHIDRKWQAALLAQLREYNQQTLRSKSGGGGGSKPLHAPMPINVEADELYGDAIHAIRNAKYGTLRQLHGKARRLLGYDSGTMAIGGTVCHQCGGRLVVARDASTSVRCTGLEGETSCGQEYPTSTWLDLL